MSYLGRSAKLSLKAQEKVSFLATAGQTVKTGLSYTPSFIEVYVNGVLLTDTTDFTATNGNSITFTVALLLNDEVTVISLKTFTVADHYTKSDADTLLAAKATIANFTSTGIDDNATSTAVTIDASENVLVGKTTTALATVGLALGGAGFVGMTRDGYEPLSLNRLTSDCAIANFYKDSTVVGSIGVTSSGASISLGGTGAANTLDDYEEGTWTAVGTWATQGTGSNTGGSGTYTKIGDTVHAAVYLQANKGNASGNFHVAGLPFAATDSVPVSLRVDGMGATSKVLMANTNNGNTNISFLLANQSTSYGSTPTPTNMHGTVYMQLQVTYRV